jgi:hypothetical protein
MLAGFPNPILKVRWYEAAPAITTRERRSASPTASGAHARPRRGALAGWDTSGQTVEGLQRALVPICRNTALTLPRAYFDRMDDPRSSLPARWASSVARVTGKRIASEQLTGPAVVEELVRAGVPGPLARLQTSVDANTRLGYADVVDDVLTTCRATNHAPSARSSRRACVRSARVQKRVGRSSRYTHASHGRGMFGVPPRSANAYDARSSR